MMPNLSATGCVASYIPIFMQVGGSCHHWKIISLGFVVEHLNPFGGNYCGSTPEFPKEPV